jgi:hypothetical protein
MYIIDMDSLREGDVIFTSQKGIVSAAVRKATSSNFSHAILYVGQGSYIHSDSKGVRSDNIQRMLFRTSDMVAVLRPKDCSLGARAVLFSRGEIGKEYSVREALAAKSSVSDPELLNRQFCSRLVAQSYAHAGLKLVPNPDYCSPQDILESSELEVVSGCVRKAAKEEVEITKTESPLETQTKITNSILKQARKLAKTDIQGITGLTQFVIDNPGFDSGILKIVEKSGYLGMWYRDVENCPWRYDSGIFLSLPASNAEKLKVANRELEAGRTQAKFFQDRLREYMVLHSQHNLKYTQLFRSLYSNLVPMMQARIHTAQVVIDTI